MKNNKNQQNATDIPKIDAKQQSAIDSLALGLTVTAAAAAAGVARETVSGWANHDDNFIVALSERRVEVWEVATDKLRNATATAADTVLELLEHDDANIRLKAAALIFSQASGTKPEKLTAGELRRRARFEDIW